MRFAKNRTGFSASSALVAARVAALVAALVAAIACGPALSAPVARADDSPAVRAPAPAESASTSSATPAPLRIAVIGASASAGFGCVLREARDDGNYAGSFRLIEMVRLACPELELVTSDLSSGFFFLAPVKNGAKAARRASEFAPDCVLALDFLFWYGYGDDDADGKPISGEDARVAKFERGLDELSRFEVPVLVGDMPDMSPAVGKMLSRRQMPAAETLAKLNARLAEWAAKRPNVRLVPLARMQAQLMRERALEVGGARLESTPERPLLQKDELHPAPYGMAGLACEVAAQLKSAVAMRASEAAQKAASDDACEPEPISTYERARGELKPSGRAPEPQEVPAKGAAKDGAKGAGTSPAKN